MTEPTTLGIGKTVCRSVVSFLACCGFIVLLATGMQLLASQWWLADVLAQFAVQYVMLLVPVVVIMLVARRWRMALLLALPLILNAWLVKDYYYYVSPVSITASTSTSRIRVLTQNVLQSNESHDQVIDLIRRYDPDIVALQEVDAHWMQKLELLRKNWPFIHHVDHKGTFGIAILSKLEWESIDTQWFGQEEIPSIHVQFLIDNRHPLEFVNTHPLPPVSGEYAESRNGQLLLTAGKMDKSRSRILAGDFNLTPWSPWFREILKQGDLRDAALGYDVQPTWFAGPTWLGGVLIDHVLVSPDLIVENYQVGESVGSDHRSVIVDIVFPLD